MTADTARGYERLIDRFVEWAGTREDIRAAIVIGSRARSDHPADEWADLDLLVITTDPARYTASAEWLAQVGTPWLTFVEPTADGRSMERRVLFDGGLDVDFSILPLALVQDLAGRGFPADVATHLRRGTRVLVDKDGLTKRILAALPEPRPPAPPDEPAFLEVVNDFWYHAVWTAKHLRRGELWWAKGGCDEHMKRLLEWMMEWHARATRGPEHDTWFRGRFLEEWVDPRAVAALREAYAHYDEKDVWRALSATMDLFRWLAREVAERLAFSYPDLGERRASEYVERLRVERPAAGTRGTS